VPFTICDGNYTEGIDMVRKESKMPIVHIQGSYRVHAGDQDLTVPGYVRPRPGERPVVAVARSMSRINRIKTITISSQGTALHNGKPWVDHWQITFGYRSGNGFCPESTYIVWLPSERIEADEDDDEDIGCVG